MPQRPRNPAGFVRKHPDTAAQRWQGIVKYWDVTEERWRQRAKTFGKPAEAQAWVDAAVMEHRAQTYRAPSDETVAAFLDRWVSRLDPGLRESTRTRYAQNVAHPRRVFGPRRLRDLTAADLAALYAGLGADGLSPRTIRHMHTVFRRALADAVAWGTLPTNPGDRVRAPRVPRAPRTVPTEEQEGELLAAAAGHGLFALWSFIALTGCRKGEALALEWRDIDWQAKRVTIRRSLAGEGKRRRFEVPKPGGPHQVGLSDELLERLQEHRQRVLDELGDQRELPPLVFPTLHQGGWQSPSYIQRAFKEIVSAAGLPSTTRIHDLRHAMATRWLASGVAVAVVAERLGHASPDVTMRIYAHAVPGMQAAFVAEQDARVLHPMAAAASPRRHQEPVESVEPSANDRQPETQEVSTGKGLENIHAPKEPSGENS